MDVLGTECWCSFTKQTSRQAVNRNFLNFAIASEQSLVSNRSEFSQLLPLNQRAPFICRARCGCQRSWTASYLRSRDTVYVIKQSLCRNVQRQPSSTDCVGASVIASPAPQTHLWQSNPAGDPQKQVQVKPSKCLASLEKPRLRRAESCAIWTVIHRRRSSNSGLAYRKQDDHVRHKPGTLL